MPDTTIRARAAAAVEALRRGVRHVPGVPRVLRRRWRSATPHQRQTWRLSATAAVLGLVVAFTAVAVSGPWDSGKRKAESARAARGQDESGAEHMPGFPGPAPSAPHVLPALGTRAGGAGGDAAPAPAPLPTALADTLEPLLKKSGLGPDVSASVVDAVTGEMLFGSHADRPLTPASTIKLATSAAVLAARGPDHRIETTVVRAPDGGLVLVGGGDPTLTADDLDRLAARTAEALQGAGEAGRKGGAAKVRLGYDVSLYAGKKLHPIGPNANLAPVVPLMVNAARLDDSSHGPAPRAADPAEEAAAAFADRLAAHGVDVAGEPKRVTAPDGARRLATHRSASVALLVERTLTHSDNDLAEALARQTALAAGEPASFEGAAKAVRAQLRKLGLPVRGARFADGSGLDRADRMSASLLSALLAEAAGPQRPGLRAVLTGLPVAHFTGTLGSRYAQADGAGVVRAKTGTLTGVNTLAGTVVDADGRLLGFAFMTNGADDRHRAREALDRLASTLANCGCR